MMMLPFPDPAKLKTRKIVFEDVFAALDPCTLEQLKELSSKRRVIEETINDTSSITEAIAREMSGGLTSKAEQDLHKLKEYLPLLGNLIFHLDAISRNRQVIHWISNLRIQWSSALGSSLSLLNLMGAKYFQLNNIRFELGMTLFLYGAILRERACEISPVALVQSATLFREAAGVYLYLSQEVLPSFHSANAGQKPPEATSSVASVMNLICLADAQAVTIRKAEEKKATVGLLAKLHYGVAEFLIEASGILYSGNEEVKDVSPRLFEYVSSFKSLHELRSKRYLAQDLQALGQVGLSIGILREALNSAAKKIPGEESWRLIIKEEIDGVSEALAKLERENEFVWHEKIPSSDELPLPQGSKIVSAIPYQPMRYERQLVFKI
ncbi:apoptosis-linked gene 2-interacting protein X 1 [Punica granatum]|uniref:Apoptosis-linked gene 2-interacting protein X 1 n=1 Tax=Punica granatum TaxID=22663 RepID=A0A6P8D1M7_PUNGR|nr:apoptosis-linked gene 2-interacting protein X 1 [Punica granatum]XP_031387536.1 apoptosis-linked gene 2-interacting protein X 1 [Punica granatum]